MQGAITQVIAASGKDCFSNGKAVGHALTNWTRTKWVGGRAFLQGAITQVIAASGKDCFSNGKAVGHTLTNWTRTKWVGGRAFLPRGKQFRPTTTPAH